MKIRIDSKDFGDPAVYEEDSFGALAELWAPFFEEQAEEGYKYLSEVLKSSTHKDSFVAGYVARARLDLIALMREVV